MPTTSPCEFCGSTEDGLHEDGCLMLDTETAAYLNKDGFYPTPDDALFRPRVADFMADVIKESMTRMPDTFGRIFDEPFWDRSRYLKDDSPSFAVGGKLQPYQAPYVAALARGEAVLPPGSRIGRSAGHGLPEGYSYGGRQVRREIAVTSTIEPIKRDQADLDLLEGVKAMRDQLVRQMGVHQDLLTREALGAKPLDYWSSGVLGYGSLQPPGGIEVRVVESWVSDWRWHNYGKPRRAPTKREGRRGTRKAWKKAHPNGWHYHFGPVEPEHMLRAAGYLFCTRRQFEVLKEAINAR